jgi:hypothetical protein
MDAMRISLSFGLVPGIRHSAAGCRPGGQSIYPVCALRIPAGWSGAYPCSRHIGMGCPGGPGRDTLHAVLGQVGEAKRFGFADQQAQYSLALRVVADRRDGLVVHPHRDELPDYPFLAQDSQPP